MIVGLTGSICSGKETMARYLVEKHGFKAVNILDLFRKHVAEQNNFKKDGPDGDEPFDNHIQISGSAVRDQESPFLDYERAAEPFKKFDQDGDSPSEPLEVRDRK